MTYQLMENLDRTGSTSSFEIDAQFIPSILRGIFEHCPFSMDHINGESIERLIEMSIGERMECELWVEKGYLHLDIQSNMGRTSF